jgi:MFS family permease
VLTTALGASATFVGAVEGAAEAVAILLRGFPGWLSDRLPSRKPLVVAGYAASVASRVLLLFVGVPAALGAARVLDRTGKGLRTAPRDAMVADGAAAGYVGKAFGITRFLDTLGAVAGLVVALVAGVGAGPMTEASFRRIVSLALPPAALTLVVLVVAVPRLARRTTAKRYLSLRVPRGARGYLAVVALFALANSSDAFLVLRAQQLGLSFRETLAWLVGFNALAAGLAVPAGHLSDRVGRVGLLASGWIVYALVYATLAATTSATGFVVALLVYGAFYGFTEGVEKALLADLVPAAERGLGYGAMQVVLGVCALPASLLTGWLMTAYGPSAAFGVGAGLAGVAAAALGAWAVARKRATPEGKSAGV